MDSTSNRFTDFSKATCLDDLERIQDTRRHHEIVQLRCVAACREAGASWAEIGAVLGVSKQAAQQRYGGN